MNFYLLLVTAVALSMDAFAVAMCKGLAMQTFRFKAALKIGFYFGFFQGLMPLIGYFVGINLADKISAFDHWIAFFLLAFLGIKMVYESLSDEEESHHGTDVKTMLLLSLATSIDALAAGVSFAVLKMNIFSAVVLIGAITFVLSAVGVKIGAVFGKKFKRSAEITGGVILILIGIKILIEHLCA